MRGPGQSLRAIRLAVAAFLLLLATLYSGGVALSAGGPGDGTTSSAWLTDSRLLRALSAISNKDYAQAVKILRAIVADNPKFADAWNYLGYSLRKMGAFVRSETAYLTALRLEPAHRGAHEYLAELYLQTGRRQEAEELERSLSRICQYGCLELEELRAALKTSR